MDRIQHEVGVSFRYPVYFTREALSPSNPVLADCIAEASPGRLPADALFVVDDGVDRAHPGCVASVDAYCRAHAGTIRLRGSVLVIPGGERVKCDREHLDLLHEAIRDRALCRHSYVVAIGGGAVLDVVGYAAAVAHRGVRLIRMPTTVLSQDDSGVGVKNGVNAFGRKNYFGTFAPPAAVVNDFAFLPTLLDRDWRGGISEAVKAALVKDGTFFAELEALAGRLVARDLPTMEAVVRRSASLHLLHIATGGDPFETGSSRPLDFGHWAAHKLEQVSGYDLRHGEAVSIGIALDTTYSHLAGWLPEGDWRRVLDLLRALRLPIFAPELDDGRGTERLVILDGLEEFREHLGGRLTVMLLAGIGRAFDVHEIDVATMIRSVQALRQMASEHPHTVAPRAGGSA